MAARMVSGVRRSEHITPVLEDLHWLPVSQRVVFKTALNWWSGSVFMLSLQFISATSAYPLPPYQVVSIILRSAATELYWFHAPRLQLDNEVSQSTNQPQGTVCHQHSGHHGHAGERLQAGTEDAPVLDRPAPLRRLHDSGVEYLMYKCPDLLTYLQWQSSFPIQCGHRTSVTAYQNAIKPLIGQNIVDWQCVWITAHLHI